MADAHLAIWRLARRPPDWHFDDAGIEQLHNSLAVNLTDEVRALRDRGIAEYIKSSVAGKRAEGG